MLALFYSRIITVKEIVTNQLSLIYLQSVFPPIFRCNKYINNKTAILIMCITIIIQHVQNVFEICGFEFLKPLKNLKSTCYRF